MSLSASVLLMAGFAWLPAHADAPPAFVAAWGNDNWIQLGPRGIATDAAGNFFISGDYAIQKFDGNGKFLAQWGTKGDGEVQVDSPQGLAVDGAGNVYVADTTNHRILKFDSNGNYLTQWGTLGVGDGQFFSPHSIALDSEGNIYVSDSGGGSDETYTYAGRIQKFDSNGNYLSQWGTIGGANSQFRRPTGLAIDAAGHVYVGDSGNSRIQKFDLNGTYLDQWGTQGGGDGQFFNINGMAVDSVGNLYVVDSGSNHIQKFDSNGKYLTQWGTFGSGDGQFSAPSFLAFDNAGNIFVTDTGNNRVQKFSYAPAYNRNLSITKTGSGTITSDPAGIDCGSTCSADFASGTTVTLTATSADGFRFDGWGGTCSGTEPCLVTMDVAQTVTATFTDSNIPSSFNLSVSKVGNGEIVSTPAGIDCGAVCSASFTSGTTVTLTATPADGFRFDGWTGPCSGTEPCVLTMDSAKEVTATFTDSTIPSSFTLNVSKSGNGVVVSDPAGIDCGATCKASFSNGSRVTLTATAADGYSFKGWSGPCSGTGQCVVTMNASKIVIAAFSQTTTSQGTATVTAILPTNAAFVGQTFTIGWQLDQIKKGMPVRVKFAKDGRAYRVIKSTKANTAGVGAYFWKPKTGQRTQNGLVQICAVPAKGIAEVCSGETGISVK
jgi:sugar lactone lactonase YvrE